jgi:4'-phosphopantetheinyl transferase EntD
MNSLELRGLFQVPVQAGVATPSMYDAPLMGEEAIGAADWAPNRRREFAAGRTAARLALSYLGELATAVPRGPDRAPIWPKGIVGSISHCEGFCGAVAAREVDVASIGFDVEIAESLPEELHSMIFSPGELHELEVRSRQAGVDFAKVGFSAKEAFYKCHYPLVGGGLDFRDVVIRFVGAVDQQLSGGEFHIRFANDTQAGAPLAELMVGRWFSDGKFIYTGVTLPRTSQDRSRGDRSRPDNEQR